MTIHISRDGTEIGRFSLTELQQAVTDGVVRVADLAWMDGMTEWEPLNKVADVSFPTGPTPPPLPPSISPRTMHATAEPIIQSASCEQPPSSTSSDGVLPSLIKCLLYAGLALGLLFALGILWFAWQGRNADSTPPVLDRFANVLSSNEPMPLTREMSFKFSQRWAEKLEEMLANAAAQESARDMTKPESSSVVAPNNQDPVSWDSSIVSSFGYSYNLTIRKIAQNRAVIASNPFGDVFVKMLDRAFRKRGEALRAGFIDQETYLSLQAWANQ